MTDNLPTKATPAGLAVPGEFDDVDDGLDSVIENFGIATPRIVTNMKFGHPAFTDELTGEVLETINATVLATTVGRAWWEDDKTVKGVQPDCRSIDSIAPDPASPKPQAQTCAACPNAQWGEDGERPACRQSALVLIFDHDNEGVRVLRIGGTSIKRFDRFVSAFRATKRLGKAFEWVVTIGTEVVPDDYDKHQEMTFALAQRLEPAEVRDLIALRDQLGWKQALQTDLERGESEPAERPSAAGVAAADVDASEEPF